MKAHKLDPKNLVVLANLAITYEKKNDISNAIKYYKLMRKNGTKDAKDFADEKIRRLKNK